MAEKKDGYIKELLKKDPTRVNRPYVSQSEKNALGVDPNIYFELLLKEQNRKEQWTQNLSSEGENLDTSLFSTYKAMTEKLKKLIETSDGEKYFQKLEEIEMTEEKIGSAEFIRLKLIKSYGQSINPTSFKDGTLEKIVGDDFMKQYFIRFGIDKQKVKESCNEIRYALLDIVTRKTQNGLKKEIEKIEVELNEIVNTNETCQQIDEIRKNIKFVEELTIPQAKEYERKIKDFEEKANRFHIPLDKFLTPDLKKYIALVDREKISSVI